MGVLRCARVSCGVLGCPTVCYGVLRCPTVSYGVLGCPRVSLTQAHLELFPILIWSANSPFVSRSSSRSAWSRSRSTWKKNEEKIKALSVTAVFIPGTPVFSRICVVYAITKGKPPGPHSSVYKATFSSQGEDWSTMFRLGFPGSLSSIFLTKPS